MSKAAKQAKGLVDMVPLSDEKIVQAMSDSGWFPEFSSSFIDDKLREFARAIESAHGITMFPSDTKETK